MKERNAARSDGTSPGWNQALPVGIAIIATVVLPRLLMLHVSVIDWDESIYSLVGQQWTFGHVPHSTVYDHKPVGLFGIFALFFLVFGDAVSTIRLIPIVFVAATAVLLARLVEIQFGRDRIFGGLAAALYGLLTLTNGGLASNTELLVNFFVTLSVYLLLVGQLDRRVSFFWSLAVGASLGMAFQVNFLAGFLVLGVAGFYLCWMAFYRPVTGLLHRYLLNGASMLCGLLLTAVAVLLPILLFGDVADYFALKSAYLSGYQGIDDTAVAFRRISEALVPHWPFHALWILLALMALGPSRTSPHFWDSQEPPRDRRILAWIVLCVFALAAALASRRFYQHFFLLMVPGLTMVAIAFLRLACASERLRNLCALWFLLMAGAGALSSQEEFLRGLRAHVKVARGAAPDHVSAAGQFMSERLRRGETIYVYDGQPILYFLTRTVPPTRFAFPESHLREETASRFGSTPYDSIRKILEGGPRFVIAGPRPDDSDLTAAAALLYDTLDREYAPVNAINANTPADVYEKIGISGAD
ncbi:MAG TPA: glycosyltransferase family 39 protein [Steroidobacteraceae bacterium]